MILLWLVLALLAPRLSATVTFDKGLAIITVNRLPEAADRHLYVTVESDSTFQSGYRQLDSDRRQFRFEWKLKPDGLYQIEARIRDARGAITAKASATLMTMPRPD